MFKKKVAVSIYKFLVFNRGFQDSMDVYCISEKHLDANRRMEVYGNMLGYDEFLNRAHRLVGTYNDKTL